MRLVSALVSTGQKCATQQAAPGARVLELPRLGCDVTAGGLGGSVREACTRCPGTMEPCAAVPETTGPGWGGHEVQCARTFPPSPATSSKLSLVARDWSNSSHPNLSTPPQCAPPCLGLTSGIALQAAHPSWGSCPHPHPHHPSPQTPPLPFSSSPLHSMHCPASRGPCFRAHRPGFCCTEPSSAWAWPSRWLPLASHSRWWPRTTRRTSG